MASVLIIQVARGDVWTTSFDVYAKLNYWPTEAGDGIFAGNIEIAPPSATASLSWTPPVDSANWKFASVPKYQSIVGPLGKSP